MTIRYEDALRRPKKSNSPFFHRVYTLHFLHLHGMVVHRCNYGREITIQLSVFFRFV